MKKIIIPFLFILLLLSYSVGTLAQFTYASGNAYFNGGNVGIGIPHGNSVPFKLTVSDGDIKASRYDIYSGVSIGAEGSERPRIGFHVSDNNRRFKIEMNGSNDVNSERLGIFTNAGGAWAETEVFSIGRTGRIGIGTISPKSKLHTVFETGPLDFNQAIVIQTNPADYTVGRGGGFVTQNADVMTAGIFGIRQESSWKGALAFYTHLDAASNSFGNTFTEKMRLTSEGRLGIGTAAPINNLEVTNNTGTPTLGIRGDFNSKIIFEPSDGSDRFTIHSEMNENTYHDKLRFMAANANNVLVLKGDGLVGIGTDAPSQKLHIKGGKLLMSNDVFDGINLTLDATQIPVIRFTRFLGSGNNHHNAFAGQIWNSDMAEYSYAIGTGSVSDGNQATATTRMVISVNGNVGIGTPSPDERLTVKGKIHTSEVRVDLAPNVGPDYVFEKDYDLMSLSEVETYINTNKHLPEVPSAKEMEKDGMNLKEMNLILLKKVEEMTLHLIEQNAKIERQESIIRHQDQRLKSLENNK